MDGTRVTVYSFWFIRFFVGAIPDSRLQQQHQHQRDNCLRGWTWTPGRLLPLLLEDNLSSFGRVSQIPHPPAPCFPASFIPSFRFAFLFCDALSLHGDKASTTARREWNRTVRLAVMTTFVVLFSWKYATGREQQRQNSMKKGKTT